MDISKWDAAPLLTKLLARSPPAFLYHYTNQSSLLNILETHLLFASDIRFLNDSQEYKLGLESIKRAIDERAMKLNPGDANFDHYGRMLEAIHGTGSGPLYVASWSEKSDDLCQWRAYSGSGTGYAVQMDGNQIQQLAKEQNFIFAPCIYEPDERRKWINAIVDLGLEEMIEGGRTKSSECLSTITLINHLIRFSPLLKHEAFKGEQEWRLICGPLGRPARGYGAHQGRSTMVPHVAFNLHTENAPSGISNLVVGPCADQELAMAGAMEALSTYAIDLEKTRSYSVGGSQIPYRNW